MNIFVSYAREDIAHAKMVDRELTDKGYKVFLDTKEIKSGDEFPSRITYAIIECDAFIFLVSEHSLKESCWALKELQIANDQKKFVLPINISDKKIKDLPSLPPSIKGLNIEEESKSLEHLLKAYPPLKIHGYDYKETPVESSKNANKNLPPCPYRGLLHFGPNDHKNFFGRDDIVKELVARIKVSNFVTVAGPSGIGKSSVVLAGLVPTLHDEWISDPSDKNSVERGNYLFIYLRFDEDPFKSLAQKLSKILKSKNSDDSQLKERLASGKEEFSKVFDQLGFEYPEKERILIIADQFGQLFSSECGYSIRREFIDSLVSYVNNSSSNPASKITWVITRTSSDLDTAYSYPDLWELLTKDPVGLEPMKDDNLEKIIVNPAKRFDVAIDNDIVKDLKKTLTNKPSSVALLEFVMWKLWEKQTGGEIKSHEYNNMGTKNDSTGRLDGALAKHADEQYRNLNSDEKIQIRRLFLKLMDPASGSFAISPRRASKTEIDELGEGYWKLAEIFADEEHRLLVISERKDEKGKVESEVEVEVAHECLLREWDKIKDWAKDNQSGRARIEVYRKEAEEWALDVKNHSSYLLPGKALEDAIRFIDEQKKLEEDVPKSIDNFLNASKRKRSEKKWLFVIVIAIVLTVFFVVGEKNQTDRENEKKQDHLNQEKKEARDRLSFGEKYFIETNNFKRKAVEHFKAGEYPEAIDYLRFSLDLTPDDPETRIYLHNAMINNRKNDIAEPLVIAVSVPIKTTQTVAQEILRGVAQAQVKWNEPLTACLEKNIGCKESGTPLQVMIASDDNKSDIARNIAHYLVNHDKNVLAVVGHNASNASTAAIERYQGQMVMVSPTSFALNHDEIKKSSRNKENFVYTMAHPIRDLMKNIVNEMKRQADGKEIRILFCYDSKADDQKIARNHFLRVVQEEPTITMYLDPKEIEKKKKGENGKEKCDFSAPDKDILTNAKNDNVTHLFLAPHVNTVADAILMAKQNADGPKFKLFSSPTLFTADTLLFEKDYMKDLVMAVYWYSDANETHPFYADAKGLWGTDGNLNITWRTALAYDAATLITKGLKKLLDEENPSLTRKALQQEIVNLGSFDGASGSIHLDISDGKRTVDQNHPIPLVKITKREAPSEGAEKSSRYEFKPIPAPETVEKHQTH